MEQDRFKNHGTIYIVGMICLILCLSLLFFSLYILPYLIWELDYNVPEIVVILLTTFQENYNYSVGTSKIFVWLVFFIPGVIAGIISYFISNYIDNQLISTKISPPENQEENISPQATGGKINESTGFGFKILSLMILVIIVILLLQFII